MKRFKGVLKEFWQARF